MGSLVKLGATAADSALGAYANYQQASIARAQAELDANTLEAQAARKDLEAKETLRLGRLEQTEKLIEGRQERAAQKTAYAASGVKVNQGTPADVLADKAAWNEYERQKLAYQSGLQSWGLQYDASLLRQQAANTRAAGVSPNASLQSAASSGLRQFLSSK